jgi:class 3 adenylate cyclase
MEIMKPPDAFGTSENNLRQDNRSSILVNKDSSIFTITKDFTPPGIGKIIVKVLDSNSVLIFMLAVTFYALFSDDLRVAAFSIDADPVFYGLSSCAFGFFSLELILSFIFKPEYRWTFYFWLDFIATISIIPDIGWIWNAIIQVNQSNSSGNVNSAQNAGKSSRAATRSTRVIRVVRLVRLMRIAKLYKHAKIVMQSKTNQVQSENESELTIPKESRVGKKLSDIITRRVIILVMVILILNPLFDLNFFLNPSTSWDYGLNAINEYQGNNTKELINYYKNLYMNSDRPLLLLDFIDGTFWESDTSLDSLRSFEVYYAHTDNSDAIFDIRVDTKLDAKLNICKTIFVCIVLVSAAIFYNKDANELAIIPIEKMMIKVKKIASNPLTIAEEKIVDIYDLVEESNTSNRCCKTNMKETAEYETAILENTFVKIGILLALGFGEAGASIISANVKSGGDVDPLIKGHKIAAIFGFCDIRNFTDTTEELQEGVMVFVNEMARIVHSTVDHFCGAANKNIGDAFLLVWKFERQEIEEFSDPIVFKKESKQVKYLGDLALASFLKIMVKINKDPCVLKYRSNPKLLKRMPGYQVKLGFGLHLGWAIEGAIGSQFKIDASYLSHHVNMASNLEALTKSYGIPILLTDRLYTILSPLGKMYCRHIDTISLKGGRDVYKIYTSDVDFSEVLPGKIKDNTKERTKNKRRTLKFRLEQDVLESWEVLQSSKEITLIKKSFTSEFFEIFEFAMQEYLDGRWEEAKKHFNNALKIRKDDGPSKAIIAYMEEYNYKPPNDWNGIRPFL